MDVTAAIKWLNAAIATSIGHALREPEIVILKGTWRGLTYEQMSHSSEYSTNYLMRDVAPKLWKQLSQVFGCPVGKTNFRVALEGYVSANADSESDLASYGLVESGFSTVLTSDFPGTTSPEAGLYWHPAVASDPRNEVSQSAASFWLSTEGGYGDGLAAMPVPAKMHGYVDELSQAKQWLSAAALGTRPSEGSPSEGGYCRLVGIWGLGGVGKTLLAKTLVAQVGDQFDGVIWRSLKDRPTLNELCSSILMGLGVMPVSSQTTVQLLSILSQKSILLVLDGIEAILQSGRLAGAYQAGYQPYDEFFQSAAGLLGCIVVTGIEGPSSLRGQDGEGRRDGRGQHGEGQHVEGQQRVGALTLGQLSEPAAIALLQAESLADADCWPALITRYQGHPLALKSATRIIRELFDGQVAAFLTQPSVLFTDISRLLAPSFQRLSALEVSILDWLASQDVPLSLAVIQQSLPLPVGLTELVSALDSLKQRSLLAVQPGRAVQPVLSSSPRSSTPPKFYLSSLVRAYAIQHLMALFSAEGPHKSGQRLRSVVSSVEQDRSCAGADLPQVSYQSVALVPIINLSPGAIAPVQLDQWLQGHFEPDWRALDSLFALSVNPAMRLRNVYHWRDATFVKRCKAVHFAKTNSQDSINEMFLLVAVYQEGENLYQVCVQAQPTPAASVLPVSLTMSLLDRQKTALASVIAQPDDTFIQLPCFRGARSEGFAIEMMLGEHHHTERFVI